MALLAATLLFSLSLFKGKQGSAAAQYNCVFLGEEGSNSLYEDGDVVIGGLFPLHYIINIQLACTMAFTIREINERTDLLPQLKLGYHILDRCSAVNRTLSSVIIGDAGSGVSMALLQSLGSFHIPVVSYFASCSCLSNQREFPTFMRTMPSDAFQIKALAQLVRYFGWTWVGVIGVESDYARFAIQLFLQESVHYGVCAAYTHFYPVGLSHQDLEKLLNIIQVCFTYYNYYAEMQGILREMQRLNLTGFQWIASEAWATSKSLWEKSDNLLKGTLGFAIQRAIVIPGLQQHLLDLTHSAIHKLAFLTEFWEETFNCRLNGSVNNHFHGLGSNQGRAPCKGTEDLNDVYSPYSDVTQLRVSYNVYKAVYLVAYALQDMSNCKAGEGPFLKKTCADPKNFEPWQVREVKCCMLSI
uniref:Olfactory receptor C family, x3 n=1 Tax=Cyprinodon variegatus TaxID=28743 RepID=A0A3Q2DUS7_CYPVA